MVAGQCAGSARENKESETGCESVAPAHHIAGKENAAADALPRFSLKATGGDPYPDRALRPRLRAMVVDHCGAVDVDMMSGDRGLNAWCAQFTPPARSAFEGPLPGGQLWWFPRVDLIDLALDRIARLTKEDWAGTHVRLFPAQPWKSWFPKLSGCERVLQRASDPALFIDR